MSNAQGPWAPTLRNWPKLSEPQMRHRLSLAWAYLWLAEDLPPDYPERGIINPPYHEMARKLVPVPVWEMVASR